MLTQAEAVRLHVVRQAPVVGDVGELDLHLREDTVEWEPLQKVAVLQLVQEVARGEGRVHGDPAPELHNLGVDHLDALLACYGDSVVAIFDEVGVPDLVEAYRRQLFGPEYGLIYLLPTPAHARFRRQEGPVEVPVTSDASYYLGHRHDAHPKVGLLHRPQRAPHLVEGEQLVGVRVFTQVRPDALEESLPAGAGEILVRLLVGVHEIRQPCHIVNLQPALQTGNPSGRFGFRYLQDLVATHVDHPRRSPARNPATRHPRTVQVHMSVQPQRGLVPVDERKERLKALVALIFAVPKATRRRVGYEDVGLTATPKSAEVYPR